MHIKLLLSSFLAVLTPNIDFIFQRRDYSWIYSVNVPKKHFKYLNRLYPEEKKKALTHAIACKFLLIHQGFALKVIEVFTPVHMFCMSAEGEDLLTVPFFLIMLGRVIEHIAIDQYSHLHTHTHTSTDSEARKFGPHQLTPRPR